VQLPEQLTDVPPDLRFIFDHEGAHVDSPLLCRGN
jgi:hypothetical protein